MTLNDDIVLYLKAERAVTFQDLLQHLRGQNSSISAGQVTDAVWGLARTDVLTLEDIVPATNSIGEYLKFWERNVDLYFVIGISIFVILTSFAPVVFPVIALKWILGPIFVLFIPGFTLTEILFPKRTQLNGNQRIALSVGLSLAIVPLVGLALNYSPWGIRLTPLVAALVTLTIGMSLVCFVTRYETAIHPAS